LAKLLDYASQEKQVQIKRRDGQTLIKKPVKDNKSLLDVAGVSTDLSLNKLNVAVRDGRERF
jgi:hypothetical protein